MGGASIIFARLTLPEWQGEYRAALLQLDQHTLLARGGSRGNSCSGAPSSDYPGTRGRGERQAIEDSLRLLRTLKGEKV